jgi:hypothetical protein
MDERVFGHILGALDASWVTASMLGAERSPLGNRPSSELDRRVDAGAVTLEILEFDALQRDAWIAAGVTPGTDDEQEYVVLRDGRWHPDPYQAYLMQLGMPHLTPREWLDRSVQLRTGRPAAGTIG